MLELITEINGILEQKEKRVEAERDAEANSAFRAG